MTMLLQNALGLLVLGLTLGGQVQSGKIIGGHEAVAHSRPYMVLLERKMTGDETTYCDGFLLSDEVVLTAAHCKASIYYIHVGLHKFINSNTPKGIEVSRAVPHKEYSESGRINDLMLLKLSNKVKFTKNVRGIKLASDNMILPQNCMVSGWGHSKEREGMALVLREVNVTIIEDKNCTEHNTYCSLGEIGPDLGDSGGPLVCEGEVAYGLVSFHTNQDPVVQVFGKIPDYLPWIQDQMKKLNVAPARHM